MRLNKQITTLATQQADQKTSSRWKIDVSFLEQGHIYFFYKPKKGIKLVEGFKDVGRFYFVLQPDGNEPLRFVVLGSKKMPVLDELGGPAGWGVIQKVGGRGYKVTDLTTKQQTGAARPIGEGIYALVLHGNHTHLLYSLELPRKLGQVQRAFRIERQANYVAVVKPAYGLSLIRGKALQNPGKFSALQNPRVLDYEGTELLLTSGRPVISRLGVSAEKDRETLETADIFSQLQVSELRHPIEPLIHGTWK